MPDQPRADPYRVLDVARDATTAQIKRRWRELAREHHPDRVAGDGEEAARLTGRMARINAAYDVLSDPVRRAAYDQSPAGRRDRASAGQAGAAAFDEFEAHAVHGPPPPPRTPPVTARFDTSSAFRPRNATTAARGSPLRGHPPISRRRRADDDLRASTPTGPVEVRTGRSGEALPTLAEARASTLAFGRYNGYTLGEVARLDPAYIDWIAHTITRDRDIVRRARVIAADLDERGIERRVRPPAPGFRWSEEVG
jgi:curved DNA-binding protein CbpA